MSRHRIPIACIQETKLPIQSTLSTSSVYNIIRQDRARNKGGGGNGLLHAPTNNNSGHDICGGDSGIGVSTVTTTSSGSGAYVGSNYKNATDTADPNWQATKATVLERNAAMFKNELMSDVKFIVGCDFDQTQTTQAHKYVLATSSAVFYEIIYSGLAENTHEIEVADVAPEAFLTLLRYLYYVEIQLEPNTVLATLYPAKIYIVPHLARVCVNYLQLKVTAKNACLLLSQSRPLEEPELMQRCWRKWRLNRTLKCKDIHLLDAALNMHRSNK